MVSLLSVKLEGKYNFFQYIFDKKFMNQDHCGAQNSHTIAITATPAATKIQ